MKTNRIQILVDSFKQFCETIYINYETDSIRNAKEGCICKIRGAYGFLIHCLYRFNLKSISREVNPTKKDKETYASYENFPNFTLAKMLKFTIDKEKYSYPIFSDDCGQCFATLNHNNLIGLGTYNLDYVNDIIGIALNNIYNEYIEKF